jgi:hypothetical protein
MFEGISAKTAALFGVAAGMALSIATGFKPNVQFDMKVNFQPQPQKDEAIKVIDIEQAPALENQQSPEPFSCEACGKG